MFENWDKNVKKLDSLDIALIKWSAVVVGIIIIKILPQLIDINWLLLIVLLAALAARPMYKFWS